MTDEMARFAARVCHGDRDNRRGRFLDGRKASGSTRRRPGFKSAEEMIPMRDGVKLHTLIFSPEGLAGQVADPVLANALRDRRPGERRCDRASGNWPTTGTFSSSRTSAGNSSRKGNS